MAKINFTKSHLERLQDLALEMLFVNGEIRNKLGVPLSIVELLHTTSINQLNEIKFILGKKIETIESRDEWVDPDNDKLELLKKQKELVNLIVGWKRYLDEINAVEKERKELEKEIAELEESEKTPQDRIKEKKARLKELEEF